jgi:hypothetical protein
MNFATAEINSYYTPWLFKNKYELLKQEENDYDLLIKK